MSKFILVSVDEQIRAALDAGLARKGLRKVDGDSSADLFIGYQTTEQVQEQIPAEFACSYSSAGSYIWSARSQIRPVNAAMLQAITLFRCIRPPGKDDLE